jgi:hypothetical protein
MKKLAGIITVVFAVVAFLTLSQTKVLAWGINYPGGRVQWGNDGGAVRFPGGEVRWGEYGAVQFPGGRVDWNDRGRGGVGINVPGFNYNKRW